MKRPTLQVLDGNLKENLWMHDPNIPQEDVDFINEAFKAAAKEIGPEFEKLIWNRTPTKKPELKRVK